MNSFGLTFWITKIIKILLEKEKSKSENVLTTDIGIIKKANLIKDIEIKDPIDFIRELLYQAAP